MSARFRDFPKVYTRRRILDGALGDRSRRLLRRFSIPLYYYY